MAETSFSEIEHNTLLDTVRLRFWDQNFATTELETLSHLCVELATSLQAGGGGGENVVSHQYMPSNNTRGT